MSAGSAGKRAALRQTEEAMERARQDIESTRPEGMSAGEWYCREVDRLTAEQAISVTKAASIVAEANGVSTGNVIAQRGAYRRSQGIRPLGEGRKRSQGIIETGQAWSPPRDLADILDSLSKTQQEQAHLVAALKSWAQAQEQSVAEARERARDAVIREIKAAADKL